VGSERSRDRQLVAYRYYLGLSVAFSETEHDPAEAAALVGNHIAALEHGPSGCTILEGTGFLEGDAERTLVIYVAGFTPGQHRAFLRWLATTFDQVSVAYEAAAEIRLYFSPTVKPRSEVPRLDPVASDR
tara:strand:- start:1766 stop:2155 length:390 start_codon:yes stop_codon:yes gene_type:complete